MRCESHGAAKPIASWIRRPSSRAWRRSCHHLATRSSAFTASSRRTRPGARRWCRQRLQLRRTAERGVRARDPRHPLNLPPNNALLRCVGTAAGQALRHSRYLTRSHLREQSPPLLQSGRAFRSAASTGQRYSSVCTKSMRSPAPVGVACASSHSSSNARSRRASSGAWACPRIRRPLPAPARRIFSIPCRRRTEPAGRARLARALARAKWCPLDYLSGPARRLDRMSSRLRQPRSCRAPPRSSFARPSLRSRGGRVVGTRAGRPACDLRAHRRGQSGGC